MLWARRNLFASLLACLLACGAAQRNAAAVAPAPGRLDPSGDPLPAGAVSRLGTTRLRHVDRINGVRFHPNGKTLISAGDDGDVITWDVANGRRIRSHRFADREIKQLDLSPDGRRLLIVDERGSVVIADTETGRRLYALSDVAKRSRGAVFSPTGDALALISGEGHAQLWRIEETGLAGAWTSAGDFQRLVFSPDGAWLAAAEYTAIRRFSADTGEAIGQPLQPEAKIRDFDVSANGSSLVACLDDGAIELWNFSGDGKPARSWRKDQAHGDRPISCVRFSPDGKQLISAGYDQIQRIWNAGDGRELRRFHGRYQYQACWSPDGKTLAAWGGGAVAVVLRDAETGEQRPALVGHQVAGAILQFLDDGRLATAAADGSLRVWDLETGQQTRLQKLENAPPPFPIAGTNYVCLAGPEGIELPDVLTGMVQKWNVAPNADKHYATPVDADEKRLLTAMYHPAQEAGDGRAPTAAGSELITWRIPDGERIGKVEAPGEVKVARLLPDGKRLAVITRDGDRQRLLFLSLDGSSPAQTIADEEYSRFNLADMAVSPTGDFLAVARGKRGVQTLELPSGKVSHDWPHVDFAVRNLAISNDGRRVLVAGGSAHVWEPATGSSLCRQADDFVRLSPDGKLLAAVENDGTIELWEVASWRRLCVFPGHDFVHHRDDVLDLRFSPDGKRLVSTAVDATLLCWSLDPADWPKEVNQPLALDELWRRLGEREAALAYQAARELVDRPEETLALLSVRLPREIALPAAGKIDDADALRLCRARYVLEQIEDETADALHKRFRRDPPPRLGPYAPQTGAGEALPAGAVLRIEDEELLVSSDGRTVMRGTALQNQLCDPVTLEPIAPLPITGRLHAVSRDGRFCVTRSASYGEHELWEIATQTVLCTLGRHRLRSQGVFHDDGRTLLAGMAYDDLGAVDLLTGKRLMREQEEYSGMCLAPGGRTLAVCRQGVWSVLDVKFGNSLWQLPKSSSEAEPRYSTLGGYLAAPLFGGSWEIHEAATGKLWKRFPLEYRLVALSPRLATFIAARDKNLQVYETATAQPVWEIRQPTDSSVDYLPDGRRFVIRSPDGTKTVWDLGSLAATRQEGETVGEQLTRLWPDLAGDDASRALAAVFAYAAAGDEAVELLRARLPKRKLDDAELRRLVRQLDDDNFEVRSEATRKLIAQGPAALGPLNAALENRPSIDMRLQIERIKKSLVGGVGVPTLRRAAMILDQIPTPAAAALQADLRTQLPELVDDNPRGPER